MPKALNAQSIYIIDTYPVAACDNIRISRSKLYTEETYRGYQVSKKRYFYGIKVHLLVTATGEPVEFFFTPGSVGDIEGLWIYPFDIPTDSVVYADKAYNDYRVEDALAEAGIELKPIRFGVFCVSFRLGSNIFSNTIASELRPQTVKLIGFCPSRFMRSPPKAFN